MATKHNLCNECTVRKCTIFSNLNDSELSFIGRLVNPTTFKKRDTIFFENDPMRDIYLVKNGIIKIYKSLKDGRQQILRLCGLGDVVGLDTIFSGRYASTAQAVTDSVLCKINKKDFINLLSQKHNLAFKLLQTTSNELAFSRNQIFNLGARTAKERIADFLIYVYNSQCDCEANPKRINLFVTRQEISELLGIKQETAVRILSKFKDDDLISIERRQITLLNTPALARIAQGSAQHFE